MSKLHPEIVTLITDLRNSAQPDRLPDVERYINTLLMKYLGNPDMTSLLFDIHSDLRTPDDKLRLLLDPIKASIIATELDTLIDGKYSDSGIHVMREYSQTNTRQLWKLESRSMTSLQNARTWRDFMDKESGGKHQHFVVFKLPDL